MWRVCWKIEDLISRRKIGQTSIFSLGDSLRGDRRSLRNATGACGGYR